MVYEYNGVSIYYRFFNKGKTTPIVLMHGWGVDSTIFDDLIGFFPDKTFLTIDFPPFGKSGKNVCDWNIFTYVGMFISLCENLNITKCDILSHSFGGRIAIIVSSINSSLVQSCIFVDSAGMKPRHSLKYHIKVLKYKFFKKHKKDVSNFGSSDYRALSPQHRKLFNRIVNEYLEVYAKEIKSKSLLIWGKCDTQTPLYMARRMKKLIKESKLLVLENCGHFPFIECRLEFYKAVSEFWEAL